MADGLNWSTLTLLNRTYIDDDARASELDLLFTIERGTDEEPLALYVLLEHQSEPSRYMRLRLLKYCCRIWEQAEQEAGRLRAIVPVVLYQGRRRWPWPTELSRRADCLACSRRREGSDGARTRRCERDTCGSSPDGVAPASAGIRPAAVIPAFEGLRIPEQGDHAQQLSAVMGAMGHEVEQLVQSALLREHAVFMRLFRGRKP